MKISYIVRRGAKALCEDAVLAGPCAVISGAGELTADFPLWIGVCDGVGGNPGGSPAAAFTVSRLMEEKPGSPEELREVMQSLNARLIAYGRNLGLGTMAAAFTGCYFTGDRCLMAHCGNTRLWKVNGGSYLDALTADHTVYQQLLSAGMDTEGVSKSEIYCCLGAGSEGMLEHLVTSEPLPKGPGAPLLFTTDGIHDYLTQDRMEQLLSDNTAPADRLAALTEAALEAGSRDDMSAALVTFGEG
ncbi:MAG: hypothetical protein IK083_03850 [Abditibacteriota bacterium]|nr:hypothetical protein [Abditibacteriota bacterium]